MPRSRRRLVLTLAAGLLGAILAANTQAGIVTLTGSDGYGEHSFDSAGHWNSGAAPTSGNDYVTANFICRTPSTIATITFLGDSLTVSPGGALYAKMNNITTTINILTNSGRVVNANGATFTLLGNMYVTTNAAMDTGSGNSSVNDVRSISNAMTIVGTGILTNYTSENAGSPPYWQTARGIVTYAGNNSGFTGAQVITKNTIVRASSQANLGGNPPVFNAEQLVLNNGHFQPLASFSLNNPNSGITIAPAGGTFNIGAGLILTNANALAGSGTLSLTNSGTLVHAGTAASFTGTLAMGGGTLVLDTAGSLAGPNTINIGGTATFDVTAAGITLASGQTLAGSGTVLGAVTVATGSKVSPAGAGGVANLPIGTLNLTGGGTLAFDFSGSTNDVIVVSGNVSASGTTSIQLVSVPPSAGTYTLMTVAGTLGGAPANFSVSALSTRSQSYSVSYDQASSPKRVLLTVTSGGAPANLVWQGGAGGNAWDIITTANWLNGAVPDVYYDLDTVNFTDAGVANQPVILDVVVNPTAVNYDTTGTYTNSGTGAIAGATAVNKGGTGTVVMATTNTYTGGTLITNGVLKVGGVGALGNPSGATALAVVTATGTLDLNGMAVDANYTNAIRINGHGFSGAQGAIDNTGGGMTSGSGDVGINNLVLDGNSTVSAPDGQNWQIGNPGLGITGNGYTLTKIGGGYLYLRRAAVNPLSSLVIAGGGVLFWDRSDCVGATTPLVLTNGGFIDTWNPANYNNGLTFANPIIVSDPVNGGKIMNHRGVTWNHPTYDIYNGSVTLNGTLMFSNVSYYASTPPTYGRITMNGNISGTGGVFVQGDTLHYLGSGAPEFYGGNLVIFNGNNSYSGLTVVTNLVRLLTTTANQSGGAYDVVDYATLDVAVAAGKPTMPMSSLTLQAVNLGPANLGFTRLSMMPSSPVLHVTNLTINAGCILPPLAGYTVGQFPLVKYEGTIGGNGFAGLQLGSLPSGVTASLVDNSANKTIDLLVSTVGIIWKGTYSTSWDIGIYQNWYNPVTLSPEFYADGQTVVFDDTASTFYVDLSGTVMPAGITVNANNDYYFNGTNIAGTGALIKNGSGTLTISNINNVFTGGTYINAGTIKLADRDFVYPYGGGALNNNLGYVMVGNGGTLDVNGVQVPNYQSYAPDGYNVFLSGAGVGGNGALINSSTNNNDLADPGYVTLTGDAVVGGIGDVNIRHGVAPQLSSQSSAYTLTKVGTGQFRIRYITAVSTNFGAVNVLQGIVSYESTSPLGFGDAGKPITVASGAGFAWGTANTRCERALICSNNATLYARNTTANVFNGPVTLDSGVVNFNANYYNGMTFSNVISGAGALNVQYQSYVTLAAANTYTGPTIVANCNAGGGTILRLVGDGSINNSSGITLMGIAAGQAVPGGLDVSGRTDGTLTLTSAQTLRGDNGSWVRGNVIASTGTTLSPGGAANIQYMTLSNNLVLQAGSTVAVDVNADAGLTNDLINVRATANYGGTLQVANIGATVPTNGATFKLFNANAYTGDFAAVSGTPGPGMTWSFNPTNGVLTAIGSALPPEPPPVTYTYNAGTRQLTLSWPPAYLSCILQAQTNSLAIGLQTNGWVDIDGSGSSTQAVINVSPTEPTVFYRLRRP